MEYKTFKDKVIKSLSEYKQETLLCDENGNQNGQEYRHILPQNRRLLNLLPTVKNPGRAFNKHIYSHHLTSPQMMCYNFFKPLIEMEDGRDILLEIISNGTGLNFTESSVINDENNKEYFFAYHGKDKNGNPSKEGMCFDLFLKLSSGERIYWEVKYIEQSFGKTKNNPNKPNKYQDKWDNIYINHLANSLYLKDLKQEEFYENYQIYRNISYLREPNDYLVLLLCGDNTSIKNEAENVITSMKAKGCNNIIIVDWHSICNDAIRCSENTRYYKHFQEFKEKYLSY